MSAASQIAHATTIIASGSSSSYNNNIKADTEKSPSYHRKCETLEIRQHKSYLAKQRSHSLFDSISEGEIEIDSILAIPIDWAGIASVYQFNRATQRQRQATTYTCPDADALPTMNPYVVKNRPRSRQTSVESVPILPSSKSSPYDGVGSSSLPTFTSSPIPMSRTPSALGLDVTFIDRDTQMDEYSTDSECPPSPTMSLDTISHRSSYSASEASTPQPFNHLYTDDASFDLKSYCSAFNEGEREGREDWWAPSRP